MLNKLWGSFLIALSMYSAIPVRQVKWEEEMNRYVLGFFPIIGVIIGGLEMSLLRLSTMVSISVTAKAVIGTVIPLLITGGIHMDGFLDTTDALQSFGDREKKLAILKDPHTGAFAVIGCGIYLLLYAGGISEILGGVSGTGVGSLRRTSVLAGVLVLERAISAWEVLHMPKARQDGLAVTFGHAGAGRGMKTVLVLWIFISASWICYFGHIDGILCLLAMSATWMRWRLRVLKNFGGITGDLAGDLLQRLELMPVLILAACTIFHI